MNAKYMFYLHRRLMLQQHGNAELYDIVARKTLKSVARATANRLSANKWLRTLEFLFRSCGMVTVNLDQSVEAPAELTRFIDKFRQAIDAHATTHKVSVARTHLILSYLEHRARIRTAFPRELDGLRVQFESRGDTEFFDDFIQRIEFTRAGCGHITDQIIHVNGTRENYGVVHSVCSHCAEAKLDSREYVQQDGTLLLTEFAVVIHSADNRTYLGDRRNPNYRYHEPRGIWADRYWQQYSNIIDQYHSSRTKGWRVIESDWFRRHRRAYGLELEIQNRSGENSHNMAGRIHEVLNPSGERGEYCYFERDGSIGEGFELITQPAGLDTHRAKLDLFLNNQELKKGLRSHEGGSCGLHIHVGRQYLTQAQIYRAQSFLNDIRNEGIIKKISRRYGNSYARLNHAMAKLSPIGKNTGERYEALNVTNRDTIEFRIFRGSLRYESVMAALEFVDALLTFCMPGQVSIMEFNSIGFRKFLANPSMSVDTTFLRPYLSINSNTDNEQSIRLAA